MMSSHFHTRVHDRSMRVVEKETCDALEGLKCDVGWDWRVSSKSCDTVSKFGASPYHNVHELAVKCGVRTSVLSFKAHEFVRFHRKDFS